MQTYIIRSILTITTCFLLGVGAWSISSAGYLQPWEKLSPQPQDINEYFLAIEELNPDEPRKVTKPCDYSMPEFSQISNHPQNIVDCVQESMEYPDGFGRFTTVLDNDGSVWKWKQVTTSNEQIGQLFCYPTFGLLIGVMIIVFTKPNKKR